MKLQFQRFFLLLQKLIQSLKKSNLPCSTCTDLSQLWKELKHKKVLSCWKTIERERERALIKCLPRFIALNAEKSIKFLSLVVYNCVMMLCARLKYDFRENFFLLLLLLPTSSISPKNLAATFVSISFCHKITNQNFKHISAAQYTFTQKNC